MSAAASALTKAGMIAFLASLISALLVTLPTLRTLGFLLRWPRAVLERRSLWAGQFFARHLLKIVPFAKLTTKSYANEVAVPAPTVWTCNHQSMLDIFFMLAGDKALRGPNRRPIKVVYWKDLEKNPVTRLLFRQCGFIPVAMTANGAGEANDYDASSFKALIRKTKEAFENGFDLGILPEGQLNPEPEEGLQPCFAGAYSLAKMVRRERSGGEGSGGGVR
jgi:1-acyl-sn-glycerol-3-phosphate acyltransferase